MQQVVVEFVMCNFIQCVEGFIYQQQFWLGDQVVGDGDVYLYVVGEFVWQDVGEFVEVYQFKDFIYLGIVFCLWYVGQIQWQFDVIVYVVLWYQGGFLEDE